MALLLRLTGWKAFIIVVPFADQEIILRFHLFYLFWNQQKNKWDVKGQREHFVQSQELAHGQISWRQDLLVQ